MRLVFQLPLFVWPATIFPRSQLQTHLPLTLVLPKDQLAFVSGRLDCGDIMILSHIRLIRHAPLVSLLPLRCSQALVSNPALCVCLITVTHLFALCVHLLYAPTCSVMCVILSTSSTTQTLLFVIICRTSTCYSLFMRFPHNLLFLALRLFLTPQLLVAVCSERRFDVST